MINPGYTIMTEDPDSRNGALMPIRDDANNPLTFATPQEAYDYYRNKYWGDTKYFHLVKFLDHTIEIKEQL